MLRRWRRRQIAEAADKELEDGVRVGARLFWAPSGNGGEGRRHRLPEESVVADQMSGPGRRGRLLEGPGVGCGDGAPGSVHRINLAGEGRLAHLGYRQSMLTLHDGGKVGGDGGVADEGNEPGDQLGPQPFVARLRR